MHADDLDTKLITSAFTLIAERGWGGLSLAEVARHADEPLARMRSRMPDKATLLIRFGTLADRAAMTGALTDGPVRDRIFDIVMRRIDVLQAHRPGVVSLLRELPQDPLTALLVAPFSLRSMAWLLDAVRVDTSGLRGALRVQGMQILWVATIRAWTRDESEDLSPTMAALDQALNRAGQAENTLADILGRTASDDSDLPQM